MNDRYMILAREKRELLDQLKVIKKEMRQIEDTCLNMWYEKEHSPEGVSMESVGMIVRKWKVNYNGLI